MLISLIALIGIVFVGGICAFIFFGPRSEPQPIVSSTAAYEEEAVDETATEPAANEAAEKDESTAEKSTDAKSDATKQRANTDDDAQQNIDVASEEAQHAQHVQRADSDRVVGGGVDGEAAGVAAPADVANDAGIPAGDEQPPEATQDVVRVTIEKNAAKNVLEGMLNLWASGISHASAMSKSPHVAKFALSQWKDRGDELDSYLVSDEKDFYSDSEQRFWVLMEFRNQGAESTRKLYSMTADAQGNWIVEPVEKPQAEVAAEDDDFSEVPKNEFGFGD